MTVTPRRTSAEHAEHMVLLCAARVGPNDQIRATLEPLIEHLDWHRLLGLARRHHVAVLLHASLARHAADLVPTDVLEWLERYRTKTIKRSLHLTAQLARVFGEFERAGVEALSFKGPTLAALAYGDLGLREFSDLDVFVRRRDVPVAAAALETLGFRSRLAPPTNAADPLLASENVLAFRSEAERCVVELHWALNPKYVARRGDADDIWRGLTPTLPGGRRVPTMAPERLLRFLCVHAAKHRCERLVWLCDIARLPNCGVPIDWTRLVADAERAGSRRMLWLGLGLARDLLGAPVPADVSARIDADAGARWLSREAAGPLTGGRPIPAPRRLLFHLVMRERLRDQIQFGVHAALTPSVRDFESRRLPKSLSLLYGPLRPFRLLREHTGHGRQP